MLTFTAVAIICTYSIGLRADRIHAGRTVTEPGTPGQTSRSDPFSVGGTLPGSVTPRLYRGATKIPSRSGIESGVFGSTTGKSTRANPHSVGYWHWQLKVRTQQRDNAVRYARKLERIIRTHRGKRVAKYSQTYSSSGSVADAICAVFGSYCSQAISVARCESGLSVNAANGQYLGLFQMGDYARSRYGHSWDAWGQARAAYRYFRDSGYSWSPWQCRP